MGDAPPTSDPPCTSSSVPSTHSGGAVSGDTSGDAPDDGARTVASDAALAGPGPAGPVSDTAGPKWSQQMHSLDCVIRNRGLIETADVETLWQAAHALLSHAGPSARAGGADAAAGAAPAGARRRVTEKGRVGALEAEVAEKTAQIKELQLRIAALAMRESVLTGGPRRSPATSAAHTASAMQAPTAAFMSLRSGAFARRAARRRRCRAPCDLRSRQPLPAVPATSCWHTM
jgi:hypothetical protein